MEVAFTYLIARILMFIISWSCITALVMWLYGKLIRFSWFRPWVKEHSFIHRQAMAMADWIDIDVAHGRRQAYKRPPQN